MSNATITLTPAPNEKDCFLKAGPFEIGSRAQHQSNRQMFGQVVKIFKNFDESVIIRVRHPNGELWDLSYFTAVTGWPQDYLKQLEEAKAAEGQPSIWPTEAELKANADKLASDEAMAAARASGQQIPRQGTETCTIRRSICRITFTSLITHAVDVEVIHPEFANPDTVRDMAQDYLSKDGANLRRRATEISREEKQVKVNLPHESN